MNGFVLRAEDAAARLPHPATPRWPEGDWYETVLARGDTNFGIFTPRGNDHQVPHNRDEAYVVVAGSAVFTLDGTGRPVGAGDLIYVAAYAEHRFRDMSADFSCWVMFFGPEQLPPAT